MNTRISSRRVRQSGSAMVETALVGLAVLVMIIGAFDFGQFLFVHQALVERARSSARWGAVTDPNNSTAIQNMVLYNQSSAPTTPSGYFGLNSSMVQVSMSDTFTDNSRLNVVITNYPYTILSPYIAGTYYGPNILVTVPLGEFCC